MRKSNKKRITGVRIYHKPINKMSDAEYNQCRRLGYKYGCIRDALRGRYEAITEGPRYRSGHYCDPKDSAVVLAKDRQGRVLSWALLQDMTNKAIGPEAMFWTRTRYRKMGLGRRVARKVKKVCGDRVRVYLDEQPRFFGYLGLHREV